MPSAVATKTRRGGEKDYEDPAPVKSRRNKTSAGGSSRRSSSLPRPPEGDDEPNNDTAKKRKEGMRSPSGTNLIARALNNEHEKSETTEEKTKGGPSKNLPPSAGTNNGAAPRLEESTPRIEEQLLRRNAGGASSDDGNNSTKDKEENPDEPDDDDDENESGGSGAYEKKVSPTTTADNNNNNDDDDSNNSNSAPPSTQEERRRRKAQEAGGGSSNHDNRDETASPSMHEIIPSHITINTNGGATANNIKSPGPPRAHHHLPASPRSSKKLRKAPAGLEESTFASVKEYLTSDSRPLSRHLNDDEVVQFMVRLYHLSNRQAQYQRHLFNPADSDDDDDGNSDDKRAETALFYEILADEQEHALGHELIKTMVADIKKKKSEEGIAASESQEDLDPRTLNWIKKAAGMNRSSASQARRYALQQAKAAAAAAASNGAGGANSEGAVAAGGDGHPRRMVAMKTRTAARQSREQKRQRGIKLLSDALDDIEKEFGPFVRKKKKQKKEPLKVEAAYQHNQQLQPQPQQQDQQRQKQQPSSKRQREADYDDMGTTIITSSTSKMKKLQPRLVATIRRKQFAPPGDWIESTKDVILRGILIDGKQLIKKDDGCLALLKIYYRPNKPKAKAKRPAASRKRKADELASCLRTYNWERSRLSKSFPNENRKCDGIEVVEKADVEFLQKADKSLPFSYKQAGITCRIPDWGTFDHPDTDSGQRKRRHSDATYASFCSKLMKAISGPARSWATCEFFYSDLDRAWYNRNTLIEEMAKVGVDPDMRLTQSEWKAIRRRVAKKPRRFSRRFIASQLNERNAYRSRVRMLQHVPALAFTANFPYNIPAPIKVGTTVTAYSRRFRMIQRGVILSRDELNARYLVLFENKVFGCEYCPDSEVATHGGPEMMVKVFGADSYLSSIYDQRDTGIVSFGKYGSRGDPGLTTQYVSVRNKLEKALQFSPHTSRNSLTEEGDKRNEASRDFSFENVKNETAEREMLVVLLKTADAATRRKEALLVAIEKVTSRLEEYQSSKEPSGGPLLSELKDHFAWLWANTEETDRTLNLALHYIRSMYGDSAFCEQRFATESNKSELVEDALSSVLLPENPVPEAAENWAVQLACGAEDVSGRLVKIMMAESNDKKKEQQAEKLSTIKGRLRAVGQLLLSASCGQGMASAPSGNDHVPPTAALAPGANKLFALPEMTFARVDAMKSTDLQLEVSAARDTAMADLKEALNLLHTELAVSNARHKLNQ